MNSTTEDYQKLLLALFLALIIAGMEFVTVNRIDSLNAALLGLIFGILTSVVAALFTEFLYSGAEEIQN